MNMNTPAVLSSDTIQLVGIKADGIHHNLGETRMPAKMKARELVREVFGDFDPEDSSDGALAYEICMRLLAYEATK